MSEPIRILNVVGRMDRGGIETLIMNVYRNIDRSKVQFDFLAHYGKENADYNEEIIEKGGRIYEMPVIKTENKVYCHKAFEYSTALKNFFKEHREYRILHGHMTNTAAIYMPLARKYGSFTTCIAHSHLSHTQRSTCAAASVITDILRHPVRRYATDYFACSDSAARWLFSEHDIKAGKVKTVRNGIDSSLFDFSIQKRLAKRTSLGIKDETVIGHVGRFFEPKNHGFILDVFDCYLKRHDENAVLMLVGDGKLRAKTEQKAKDMGIFEKIRFLGVRKDIDSLMQAMDIFFMPSLYEGIPLAAIEAQAAALPLLVSNRISSELDITGKVTTLPLEARHEKWADEICRILKEHTRESTRQAVIDNGYDIKDTARALQSFYLERHNSIGDIK